MADNKSANDVGVIIKSFVEHIDNLVTSLSLSMLVMQTAQGMAGKTYQAFIDKNCIQKEEDGVPIILLGLEHQRRHEILRKRVHQSSIALSVVPRSFLVSLVSQYDAFLGRLVGALFRAKPELLKSSEKSITFSQLSDFDSIESAREYVLEKEIETSLRKSHAEQFEWLEKKFDIKLRADLPAWQAFIELTERRNLFVHSDGIVSSQYLGVCKEQGVVLDPHIVSGSKLEVPQKYFAIAHATIYEIGVKLAQVLWRKVLPSELKDQDRSLSDLSFELIHEKNYELAKMLLNFACKPAMKWPDERSRIVCLVNRAQAYKWSGESTTSLDIVAKQDWSATGDAFQLAAAVLRDDFAEAASLMEKIGATNYPHKEHYRTWPCLRSLEKRKRSLRRFNRCTESPLQKLKRLKSQNLLPNPIQGRTLVPSIRATSRLT
ncbi:MAG: hypothetical protein QOD84_2857 [Acidobacteriaceae bacterium]